MMYELDGIAPQVKDDSVWIADMSAVIGNVILEAETSIWFNVTVRGDNEPIKIGPRSNIQDGAVLHSDPGMPLEIGADVTVGHQAMLHGCTIGDNSLIGMGATILNGAKIGKNSIIGAKSLITEGKEFPEGSLIVGSPARAIKQLGEEHIAMIAHSATIYVENAKRFRAELKIIDSS